MQADQKLWNLLAPKDSIASKAPMSMVSMDSYIILETTPKVNTMMAMVPAKVPSPKISAANFAITRVGSVRITISTIRWAQTTTPLRLMLVEAMTETGSASVAPMTEPRMDILMVSSSGSTTFGK